MWDKIAEYFEEWDYQFIHSLYCLHRWHCADKGGSEAAKEVSPCAIKRCAGSAYQLSS